MGTAYGLMACFQNSAQFVVPLIVQRVLYVSGQNCLTCEILFSVLSVFAFLLSLFMYMYDKYYCNDVLQHPIVFTESGDDISTASMVVVLEGSVVHHYGSLELI